MHLNVDAIFRLQTRIPQINQRLIHIIIRTICYIFSDAYVRTTSNATEVIRQQQLCA